MDLPPSGPQKLQSIIFSLATRFHGLVAQQSPSQSNVDLCDLRLDTRPVLQRGENYARGVLAGLIHDYQHLFELLSAVEYEARTIDQALAHRANVTLPAYRLPVEVLSRIFEEVCFSPEPSTNNSFDFASRRAITASCQHWRDVAVSTSSLWASWKVSMDRQYEEYTNALSFERGIGRARDRPLHLRVDTGEEIDADVKPAILAAFTRAESLFLFLDNDTPFNDWNLFQSPPLPLPFLRTLSVRERTGRQIDRDRRLPLDLSLAPNLRAFRLEADTLSDARLQCSFANTAALVHLCLTGTSNHTYVLTLLATCPNLESLVWHGLEHLEDPEEGTEWLVGSRILNLPALTRLHLSFETSKFLPSLNVPLLRHLQYAPSHLEPNWAGEFPQLQELELRDLDRGAFEDDVLRISEFLLRHTGLHSISFDRSIDHTILEILGRRVEATEGAGNPPLLFPNLIKLRAPVHGYRAEVHLNLIQTLFSGRRNWELNDPRREREEEDPNYKRFEFRELDLPGAYPDGGLTRRTLQSMYGSQFESDQFQVTFHRWDDEKEWSSGVDEWVDLFQ